MAELQSALPSVGRRPSPVAVAPSWALVVVVLRLVAPSWAPVVVVLQLVALLRMIALHLSLLGLLMALDEGVLV